MMMLITLFSYASNSSEDSLQFRMLYRNEVGCKVNLPPFGFLKSSHTVEYCTVCLLVMERGVDIVVGGGDLFKVHGWLHQGRTCRDAVSSPQRIYRSKMTSIFSQNPTLLQFVITGCVDIKFELVKFGEYINRDSIKVQSYSSIMSDGEKQTLDGRPNLKREVNQD
jgi:hypothetical protein